MSETFRLSTVGQISVRVHDLDRATAFYRDILGMSFLFPAGHMAFFDCGNLRLMLTTHLGKDGQTSIVYYKVDDIAVATSTLKERGVEFDGEPHMIAQMPDHELWMAFFKDSEGNTVALMSEVILAAR